MGQLFFGFFFTLLFFSEVSEEKSRNRTSLEQELMEAKIKIQELKKHQLQPQKSYYQTRAAKLTGKTHLYRVRTFSEATQCAICCSYMLGSWRQGVDCQECEFSCHILCAKQSANHTCPLPLEFKNKPTEGLVTVNYANEMVV